MTGTVYSRHPASRVRRPVLFRPEHSVLQKPDWIFLLWRCRLELPCPDPGHPGQEGMKMDPPVPSFLRPVDGRKPENPSGRMCVRRKRIVTARRISNSWYDLLKADIANIIVCQYF